MILSISIEFTLYDFFRCLNETFKGHWHILQKCYFQTGFAELINNGDRCFIYSFNRFRLENCDCNWLEASRFILILKTWKIAHSKHTFFIYSKNFDTSNSICRTISVLFVLLRFYRALCIIYRHWDENTQVFPNKTTRIERYLSWITRCFFICITFDGRDVLQIRLQCLTSLEFRLNCYKTEWTRKLVTSGSDFHVSTLKVDFRL